MEKKKKSDNDGIEEAENYLDWMLAVEEKKEKEAQSFFDRIWYSLSCSARFERVIISPPPPVPPSLAHRRNPSSSPPRSFPRFFDGLGKERTGR